MKYNDHELDAKPTHSIRVEPGGLAIDLEADRPLSHAVREAGIELAELCGGRGACRGCRIFIYDGPVTPPTKAEVHHLSRDELERGLRLACQVKALGKVSIRVDPSALGVSQRVLTEGPQTFGNQDPLVRAYDVRLVPPSLEDMRGDDERLLDALEKESRAVCASIDLNCRQDLSTRVRDENWHIQALVRGSEVIVLTSADTQVLGLAVDLGTTGVAGYLCDLSDGRMLATTGMLNPQHSYGEDIITRLDKATQSPEQAARLKEMAVKAINRIGRELTERVGSHPDAIAEIVIVGNTAMHHLIAGLPVKQLVRSPFIPATSREIEVKARELDLTCAKGAYLFLPPNVAAFIGSDHIAMLLAAGTEEPAGPTLFIDVGTNTEICLVEGEHMTSVSCASGPAFEGVHMSCGVRAGPGAIERIVLGEDGPDFQTIGGLPPVGLCGSGIVDLWSEMLRVGAMNTSGRLMQDHARVRYEDDRLGFVVVDPGEHGAERPIVLTQRDVRNLQLAKAAIEAGTSILLRNRGMNADDLDQVIVAGAFGSYLNVRSAQRVGLLPRIPPDRVVQVGNAAGIGAANMLVSASARERARGIARRLVYLELATQPGFRDTFIQATALPQENRGGLVA